MTDETPKAAVVSYNFETHEMRYMDFEGEDAASYAEGTSKADWLLRDFPREEGWVHIPVFNEEAHVQKAGRFMESITGMEGEELERHKQKVRENLK